MEEEKLKAKIREVLKKMNIKPKPFNPEDYHSKKELDEIYRMFHECHSSPEHTEKFYDRTAKTEIELICGEYLEKLDSIAFFLKEPPKKGHKVLDVGSGSTVTPAVAEKLTDAEYHAIDISKKMLEQSKGLGKTRVEKVHGRAYHLPFKDGSFHEVWIEKPDNIFLDDAFFEANRVLKKGGVIKAVLRGQRFNQERFKTKLGKKGMEARIRSRGERITITARKKRI